MFYKTHAARIAANIILAELETFVGTAFASLDSNWLGEVYATTMSGAVLTLRWNVETQQIDQIDRIPAPNEIIEMELAA